MVMKRSHRLLSRQGSEQSRKRNAETRAKSTSPLHVTQSPLPSTWTAPVTQAGTCVHSLERSHQHSSMCKCQRSTLTSIFSLCRIVPRQSFGDSVLPTPLIILLRLIMPAASLLQSCRNAQKNLVAVRDHDERAASTGARLSSSYLRPRRLRRETEMRLASKNTNTSIFDHLEHRMSVAAFLASASHGIGRDRDRWRMVSITWVKALATHMSHEFVQFVVEDTRTGTRQRLLADRQETGDWVSLTPHGPLEMSDMFANMGSGMRNVTETSQATPYRDRHTLPLPLVSVVFDPREDGPTLGDFASLLASVSRRSKEYNPLREHCWWFSESVLNEVRKKWRHQARLKEWCYARYRYSFVICNRWIRRRVLETTARDFEQMCLNDLTY